MSHRRQYPYLMKPVVWSESEEFIRGYRYGVPLLAWHMAPKEKLATRRQLAALGLRPNGQDPAAYLYFWSPRAKKVIFAELFLIAAAAPKRTATPAQHTAIAKANLARRLCPVCGKDAMYVIPRELGKCGTCWLLAEYGTTNPDEIQEYAA